MISLWKEQFQSYHVEAPPAKVIPLWKTLQDGQCSVDHLWIKDEMEKSQISMFTGKEFTVRRNHENY